MDEKLVKILEEDAAGIMSFDHMIYERSRFAILTILMRTAGADYLFIRRLTGLSKGNLSNHLAKLEEAGLVDIEKHFEGKKPVTTVKLTEEGKTVIEACHSKMNRITSESRSLVKDEPASSLNVREAHGGAAGA